MPISQQFESIIDFAFAAFLITGVAVVASRAMEDDPREGNPGHHSIPWEAKEPLVKKYGTWAVNRAESLCPHDDVACVEREARRMVEVYRQRRGA